MLNIIFLRVGMDQENGRARRCVSAQGITLEACIPIRDENGEKAAGLVRQRAKTIFWLL